MTRSPARSRKVAAVLAALCVVSSTAWAWGPQGHRTVGAIADQLLAGTRAEPKLRALLQPGESLARVSNWADCAKGPRVCDGGITPEMDAFVQANPLHREYHYTDVSLGQPGYRLGAPGTSDHDIVQVLLQCVQALRGNADPAANPHRFTQRQALLLLAHLVGDLHQPLHVGAVYLDDHGRPIEPRTQAQASASSNQGGNKLFVGGDPARLLHAFWDFEVVTAAMTGAGAPSPELLARQLLRADPAPLAVSDPQRDILAWTADSLQASRAALRELRYSPRHADVARSGQPVEGWSVTFPPDYEAAAAADLARRQLTLAGKRLAALLQATLPPWKESRQP